MKDNAKKRHRLSIRLKGYDYSSQGAYFVTICTKNRRCMFGDVEDRAMELSEHGRTVATCWAAIPQPFPNVALDASVVMPNHFHGILMIGGPHRRGAACRALWS